MQMGEATLKYQSGNAEGPGGQDVRAASSVGHFSHRVMAAPAQPELL